MTKHVHLLFHKHFRKIYPKYLWLKKTEKLILVSYHRKVVQFNLPIVVTARECELPTGRRFLLVESPVSNRLPATHDLSIRSISKLAIGARIGIARELRLVVDERGSRAPSRRSSQDFARFPKIQIEDSNRPSKPLLLPDIQLFSNTSKSYFTRRKSLLVS